MPNDIDTTAYISSFHDFFTSVYFPKIQELLLVYPKKKSLVVDYLELEKFDFSLADRLKTEPDLIIASAQEAIKDMRLALPEGIGDFNPNVRFLNLPDDDMLIQNLSSVNINGLVAFKSVVTKRAEVMNRVKIAAFVCDVCDTKIKIIITKNTQPPKRCESCKKFSLRQMDDESKFTDIQRSEVQELLERVSGGAPAARIELWMEDDLVNSISPGENVEVVGILRIRPPIKTKQKQEMVYARYIEVNNIKSMKKEFEEIEISKDEERRILDLSKDSNIDHLIIESVAPAIYGHKEVKHAMSLQLFGGTRGKKMQGGLPIRDDIHVLLIGDPGLAKSRILQSVNEIAPKGIYVSGKSVSGAGLTVSAEKDDLGEGGWTLKAGALVLASGGTAQIDEFDKIDEEDRASLHEAMEAGMISVAKAGMVARFRAKTAILAAANPKYGRFDQSKNLAEQFNIPPSLMSRFDLIFPIVDVLDEEKDSKLAQHILDTHMGKMVNKEERLLERDLLRKYIAYARRNVVPKMTAGASDKIKEFYVDLRKRSRDSGSVAITPRYLEGLVRLAEANAKMRLSHEVLAKDAEISISLMNYVMKQVMTDKVTGAFDVDVIATGRSKTDRDKMQKVDTVFEVIKLILKKEDSAEIEKIIQECLNAGIEEIEARKILSELLKKGEIYEKEHGHVKLVGG